MELSPTSANTTTTTTTTTGQSGAPPAAIQSVATVQELMKAHKSKMALIRAENEQRYKAVSARVATASTSLVDAVNRDVIDIFNMEQRIEATIKDVLSQTEQFHKKMQAWGDLFVRFNKGLKELGDVQHWASCIETDLNDTLGILEAVAATKRKAVGVD